MRSLILLLSTLVLSLPAHAGIGVHAGLNLGDVSTKPTGDTDLLVGMIVGGHYDLELSDMFHIEPGLQYVGRGFSFTGGSLMVHYLEIPVLAKARFDIGQGNIKPFVKAGPNFGINIGMSCSLDAVSDCTVADALIESTESLGFGLDLGAGVDIGSFTVEFRYYLGLMNLTEVPNASSKARGIGFLGGFRF